MPREPSDRTPDGAVAPDGAARGRISGSLPKAARLGRHIVSVIGIDRYAAWQLLLNAVSDARGVRRLFVEHLGFQELTPPLYDEQATRDAISSLVQDKLPSLLTPDDSLVFFFSGHGHSEAHEVGDRKVESGYLVPVDGRRPEEHCPSTLLKLESLLSDLARLPARHVLVILDACHSGFALGEAVTRGRGVERYTKDLDQRISRRVISSAMAEQLAMDSGPVPGHSLFTGTLVEALDPGKADIEGRGFVTSSALALHVQKEVGSWADSKQTPDFGSFELDGRGELVIPLRGETYERRHANESLEIAGAVEDLARATGDVRRFQSAARHFRHSGIHADLVKLDLPQAKLGLGRTLLFAGDPAAAIEPLRDASRTPGETEASALFFLGASYSALYDPEAIAVYERLSVGHPEDENAAWTADCLGHSKERALPGKKRALVVIVGRSPRAQRIRTFDAAAQAQTMTLALKALGFAAPTTLIDEAANGRKILRALQEIRKATAPHDTFVFYFAGPVESKGGGAVLAASDYDPATRRGAFSIEELHELMAGIPAMHRTLILETDPVPALIELNRDGAAYSVWMAAAPGSEAQDLQVALFTRTFAQRITASAERGANNEDILVRPARELSSPWSERKQKPMFLGDPRAPLFQASNPFARLLDFAVRRDFTAAPPAKLLAIEVASRRGVAPPEPSSASKSPRPDPLHAAVLTHLGRATLHRGDAASAVRFLDRAIALDGDNLEARVASVAAHLQEGNRPGALAVLKSLIASVKARPAAVRLQLARCLLALHAVEDATPLLVDSGAGGAGEPAETPPDLLFYRGQADSLQGRAEPALEAFKAFLDGPVRSEDPDLLDLASWVTGRRAPRKHAVLVGISEYDCVPKLRGAANDARRFGDYLVDRGGFRKEDVTLIVNEAATRSAVIAALQGLSLRVLPGDVVVVLFSGHLTQVGTPAHELHVMHDATLDSLAERSVTGEELHDLVRGIPTGNKTVLLDPGGEDMMRHAREDSGYTLICSASPGQMAMDSYLVEIEQERVLMGIFCGEMVTQLRDTDPRPLTCEKLTALVAEGLRVLGPGGGRSKGGPRNPPPGATLPPHQVPLCLGDPDRLLFESAGPPAGIDERLAHLHARMERREAPEDVARAWLCALDRALPEAAVRVLEAAISRGGEWSEAPEIWLDLGVALALLGAHERSIPAFKRALELYGDPAVFAREQEEDPHARERVAEAHYHLGRSLLEAGREAGRDLPGAVSELTKAIEIDPDSMDFHYFLGQAIRAMVEQETLAQAAEAWSKYLDAGAPLGHEEEVRRFLASRKKTDTPS